MKQSKPINQSTRLTALEARQAELEKRIANLEREAARQMPAPWTPTGPYPSFPPVLPTPQDDIDDARCHVCNNRFKDMTHYVCNNDRCPNRVYFGDSPLRVTCSTSAETSSTQVQPSLVFGVTHITNQISQ